jgi:surfeit locus 1 family protein
LRRDRVLDNRPWTAERFLVVTHLLLAPGDAVLVQRGWTARDPRARTLPQLPRSDDDVALLATVAHRCRLGGSNCGVPTKGRYGRISTWRRSGANRCRVQALVALETQAPCPTTGWCAVVRAGAGGLETSGYAFQWFALGALIARRGRSGFRIVRLFVQAKLNLTWRCTRCRSRRGRAGSATRAGRGKR